MVKAEKFLLIALAAALVGGLNFAEHRYGVGLTVSAAFSLGIVSLLALWIYKARTKGTYVPVRNQSIPTAVLMKHRGFSGTRIVDEVVWDKAAASSATLARQANAKSR